MYNAFRNQFLATAVCFIALLSTTACLQADTTPVNSPMSSASSQRELPPPNTLDQESLSARSQGIVGTVQRLRGNHMPGAGTDQNGRITELVSTKVWIFSGKVQSNFSARWALTEAAQHPRLVGWAMSDAEGNFAVGLPEGEYTALAQYEDDLYLNKFQGDGSYASVQVVENEMAELLLVNSEDAVF